jgi:WD40 domain-containing protein
MPRGTAFFHTTGEKSGLVDDATAREIVRFVAATQIGGNQSGGGRSLRKPADLSWDKLEIEPALLSLLCEGLNEKRKASGLATIDAALLEETDEAIIGDFYRNCVADVPEKTRRFIEDALITEGGFRNSYPLQDALDQGLLTEPLLRRLVDRRLLRLDHLLDAERVELIHDRLTEVVREHRNQERERLRRRRQRKRTALLVSVVAVFFLVAAALAVLYLRAEYALQAARDQARVAVAGEFVAKDPTQAALALLEVQRPDDTPYAVSRMTETLRETPSSARYMHEGLVIHAAFSPDGTRIVTACRDGTARVWRADGSGEPVVLKGHESNLNSAAFSPDGRHIVTASSDGTARVWAISGERLQAAIRSAAHQCLDPPFRKRYLGEPPEEALQKYQACERAHGRSGTFAQ